MASQQQYVAWSVTSRSRKRPKRRCAKARSAIGNSWNCRRKPSLFSARENFFTPIQPRSGCGERRTPKIFWVDPCWRWCTPTTARPRRNELRLLRRRVPPAHSLKQNMYAWMGKSSTLKLLVCLSPFVDKLRYKQLSETLQIVVAEKKR